MKSDIQASIDAKLNYFRDYLVVPANVQPELDVFVEKVYALGEASTDSMDFETRFAQSLQNDFTMIIMKCTQKPREMTAEEKEDSAQLKKEMVYDGQDPKKAIAKMAAIGVAEIALSEGKQELIAMKRKAMVESGTFRDYTVATNAIDSASRIGKLFSEKFNRKNKKKDND